MWPAVWSRIWPARLVCQPKRTSMMSGAGAPSRHQRAQIRKHFGFRPFRARDESVLVGWLSQRVGSFNPEAEALKLAAYDQLRSRRIEPPAPERLRRLLGMTVRQREERFVEETFTQLSSQTRAALAPVQREGIPWNGDWSCVPRSRHQRRPPPTKRTALWGPYRTRLQDLVEQDSPAQRNDVFQCGRKRRV